VNWKIANQKTCTCSQAIAGGCTTRDLGQFSKNGTCLQDTGGGTGEDGVTRPFTEEVVSYKHGDNVILHQWAGGGDLLVNCQSPTPQSFICQVQYLMFVHPSGACAWTSAQARARLHTYSTLARRALATALAAADTGHGVCYVTTLKYDLYTDSDAAQHARACRISQCAMLIHVQALRASQLSFLQLTWSCC
jgi:hypothetical protein